MTLSTGSRLGPYEIVDEIGAGGMGVVYRATDTTLDREVAIKVLPESMASDAERLTRFDREAKTLASLNHPNIGQIYGLENTNGTTALVLELVEGPTLADRLEKGPLSADETMAIAMQIAAALEAAHSQGIVHRDLKPANVKLKPDGTVKVLDFGIAKAMQPDVLTSEPQSPILTTPATQVGVILGTAAYMSPEQAKGQQLDQRADIWAFGCLLYEMLTGQMAFGAEDVPTTLARVIANETDLDSLPGVISPAIRDTIALCLQKDPNKRLHAMGDVRLALEGAFASANSLIPAAAVDSRPLWRKALPLVASIVVTGIVVGSVVQLSLEEPPLPISRFDYDLPTGQAFRNADRAVIDVAPNGREFVYNGIGGFYLRAMDELEARLIPTEDSLTSPAFSPDSQSLAYWDFLSGQLERISVGGGAPVLIAGGVSAPLGIAWEPDGTIFFGQLDGIYRVSANGGTPELVVKTAQETDASFNGFPYGPQLLPDGDTVLFSLGEITSWDDAQIVAQSLSTGERTVVLEGGADPRYLPTGHLVYALQNGLFARAFDVDDLTVSGGAVPLVQGVMRSAGTLGPATANYSVSSEGTLVYVTGSLTLDTRTLVWVDRNGREEAIEMPARNYTSPRLSPDGTQVALAVRDQELDIWTWDLARETLTRLTFDPGLERFPLWSPDGERIVFSSQVGDGEGLYWRLSNGAGPQELLVESDRQVFATSFLPDSSGIVTYGASSAADANDDIGYFELGSNSAIPLLDSEYGEATPELSPDGRWLAYTSNESGADQVYVRSFPDIETGRWQVSTEGGNQPLWSRTGDELFYRNGDSLVAVPIQVDPSFSAGNPEVVMEGQFAASLGGRSYDISSDGDRFLMLKQVTGTTESARIIIVENWFEELRRLVPTE